MSQISINVYSSKDNRKIEKTYTVDGYNLLLGTIEDFMNIFDLDKLHDNIAVAKMLQKGYSQIKPLLKDIFPELTDEECRRVSATDLVQTVKQIGASIIEGLGILQTGN